MINGHDFQFRGDVGAMAEIFRSHSWWELVEPDGHVATSGTVETGRPDRTFGTIPTIAVAVVFKRPRPQGGEDDRLIMEPDHAPEWRHG